MPHSTIPFHTLPVQTSFFFVRHGQSVSNLERRIQGHAESPLTDEGRRQAAGAGRFFAAHEIDRLFVSPLGRTVETAEIIASESGIGELVVVPELIELDTGSYSGKAFHELEPHDPAMFRRFQEESWEALPDAERISSLQQRARAVWEMLLEHAKAGHRATLCVTHGGMIQWIVKSTFVPAGERWMPLFPASNCGIYEYRVQSTLADPANDSPPQPGTGYFGEWRRINFIPYETES
ncbi:MAG: histidine phosphatase family protein [Spirochaetales bacterium]